MHTFVLALSVASVLVGGEAGRTAASVARRPAASQPPAPIAPLPAAWLVAAENAAPAAHFAFVPGLHAALAVHRPARATLVLPVATVGDVTLSLRRFEAVTLDAMVEIGSRKRAPQPELTAALRGVVHFEGSVEGYPHSSCYLAFGATGASGWINLGDGQGQFTLRGMGEDGDRVGLMAGALEFVRTNGTSAPEVPSCGGAHGHGDAGDGGVAGLGAVPPGVRKVVEVAVDSDFDFYTIFDDTVAATEYVAALNGAVSAIYRRDCDATIMTAYLRLQTDAADLFNEPDPLGPFRDHWASQSEPARDLFTLFTGRRNLPYGGVAWLNAACGDFGFSVNGYLIGAFADAVETNPSNWDINVVAHEFGHNLGTLHTHNYSLDSCASGTVQRGTIMSYCHVVQGASANIDLRFHRGTVEPIEEFISQAECLASDCDDDGAMDADEIAANPALDANADGILDACQDCNGNGVPDPSEIAAGALGDSDGDGLPDPCETDCDGNGVADSLEIANDPTLDVDGDMGLDSCQADCNGNGVADAVEILSDMTLDRSRDGRIDGCEDCDGDGEPDFTELRGSRSRWVASKTDTLLRELDPRSGVIRRAVPCGASPANDLAIGTDGRLYAAVGNAIWALDRLTDTAASQWSVNLDAEARAIAVAPDGRLAVLLGDGRVQLLAANGTVSSTLTPAPPPSGMPSDIAFRSLVGGGHDLLISFGAGIIRRAAWPSGALSVFADRAGTLPDFRGLFVLADNSVLVASGAARAILRFDAAGVPSGVWDVENGVLLTSPHSMCDAGDGRTVLATSSDSSSTVNGYNRASGYLERTFRVYPSDAPAATAIVVAPPSATDANGNLVPDACETVAGDLNGDGLVNGADLATMLAAWGACGGCAADLNGDGAVNAADLAILLAAWS